MDKKYLTIKEFSHQTGFSIKSLRYYDSIKVLVPSYVDQKTKYRYYTKDQVTQSYFIYIALVCEIPLTYFRDNFLDTNGLITLDKLVPYALDILSKKRDKLNLIMEQITNYHIESKRIDKYILNNIYEYKLEKKVFIIKPFVGIIDSDIYNDSLGYFFEGLEKLNIDTSIELSNYYGIIVIDNVSYIYCEYIKKELVKLDNGYSYYSLNENTYNVVKTNDTNIIYNTKYKLALIREEPLFNPNKPLYEFMYLK